MLFRYRLLVRPVRYSFPGINENPSTNAIQEFLFYDHRDRLHLPFTLLPLVIRRYELIDRFGITRYLKKKTVSDSAIAFPRRNCEKFQVTRQK